MAEAARPTEQFTIPNRWSWRASVTVSIACDPLAPTPIKLGLAVKAAFSTGAVLTGAVLTGAVLTGADLRGADLTGADLRGADLRGADLRGADLRGAVLTGAVLTGADLRGADLRGEKITRVFARADRLDGYNFLGVELQSGGVKIAAGCRWFTIEQFREHVAASYPGTDKAAETLALIDHIERMAAVFGIATSPVVAPTPSVAVAG